MVTYHCDLCGQGIGGSSDPRYVVKITAQPAHDLDRITDDDLDRDHLEAVASQLGGDADRQTGPEPPPDYVELRFDLCPECHGRFVRDPLRREPSRARSFSRN